MHRVLSAFSLLVALAPPTLQAQRPELPFFQSIAWAPDGSALVFCAVLETWDDGFRLYRIDLDGRNLRLIETGGQRHLYPAWSPDGQLIAFGGRVAGATNVLVTSPNGGSARALTSAPEGGGAPSWSPNGDRIAFHSNWEGEYQVYVMNADGSRVRRVTREAGNNLNPQWSPTGDAILYYSDRQGGGAHDTLYVVDQDGTNERKLTGGVFPTWAADGNTILFTDAADGLSHLFAVYADGRNRRLIAENIVYAIQSPDGGRIAAISVETPASGPRRYGVQLMQTDGSGRHTIFPTP